MIELSTVKAKMSKRVITKIKSVILALMVDNFVRNHCTELVKAQIIEEESI